MEQPLELPDLTLRHFVPTSALDCEDDARNPKAGKEAASIQYNNKGTGFPGHSDISLSVALYRLTDLVADRPYS